MDATDNGEGIALTFSLSQHYPTPLNPSTTLRVQIAESGVVTLTVIGLLGRTIATLAREELKPGNYPVV